MAGDLFNHVHEDEATLAAVASPRCRLVAMAVTRSRATPSRACRTRRSIAPRVAPLQRARYQDPPLVTHTASAYGRHRVVTRRTRSQAPRNSGALVPLMSVKISSS
jgi:hypothetical protein